MSLYEIYKKLTTEELRDYFNKADTLEEINFWITLIQLREQEKKTK